MTSTISQIIIGIIISQPMGGSLKLSE